MRDAIVVSSLNAATTTATVGGPAVAVGGRFTSLRPADERATAMTEW
jgi:hypothetical protein